MRNLILGTDWGEDCDDCVAVRLLARAHKRGEINLLGIEINTYVPQSGPSLYAFLKTEGIMVPIGVDTGFKHKITHVTYQKILAPMAEGKTNEDFETSVRLYRRLLAEATEPVEIMEIGFLGAVARALHSMPDDISPKTGMELFSEKVSRVWVMGGKWDEQGGKEYNLSAYEEVATDAYNFVNFCPCPVTYLGWEVGHDLITGDNLPKSDILFDLIKAHSGGPGRESWDPMLVYMTILGDEEKAGYKTVACDFSLDKDGRNYFTPNENSQSRFVVKKFDDSYYKEIINNAII